MDPNTMHWIVVNVRFREPISMIEPDEEGEEELTAGFFQDFGITAESYEAAQQRIEETVRAYKFPEPVEMVFDYEEVTIFGPDDLKKQVFGNATIAQRVSQDPHTPGIWFSTGRMFYPPESDEE